MQSILDRHLVEVSGTSITVGTLILLSLVLVASVLISRILRHSLPKAIRVGGVSDEATLTVVGRLIHYLVLLAGLVVGFQLIGIDLGSLFTAGALFAVGLGFAMQNIVQNFVSGVILMVERAIKPGDILGIEGQIVQVVDMGIRSTVARTLDEQEVIIPNSILVQNSVYNYTLHDSLYRLRASVGVAYSSDMAQVRRTLEAAVSQPEWKNAGREPRVLLREFGTSSVNFEVSVWVDHPWQAQQRLSQLNEVIWWALKDQAITIAFPQLDLHLDRSVEESLGRISGSRS